MECDHFLIFSDTIAYTASDGSQFTCSEIDNSAANGVLDQESCAYIAKYDVECGCPQRPDTTMVSCSICPSTGIQNPYVVFFVLY
jgi:hypothetical protein